MTATTETRPTGCPGYSETLPCAPESARIARNLVHTALTVWGHEDLAQDGTSIVSELVANAAQHTRSRLIEVSITHPAPAYVRIAVADRDRGGLPSSARQAKGTRVVGAWPWSMLLRSAGERTSSLGASASGAS